MVVIHYERGDTKIIVTDPSEELVAFGLILAAGTLAYWIFNKYKEHGQQATEKFQGSYLPNINSLKDNISFIDLNLSKEDTSNDFKFLHELYYSSRQKAESIWHLYNDTDSSLNGLNNILLESEAKLHEQFCIFREASDPETKSTAQKEIDLLEQMKKKTIQVRDEVKAQRNELIYQLRLSDNRTHELKLVIRDRCVPGGRIWYDRLEENKARKSNSD